MGGLALLAVAAAVLLLALPPASTALFLALAVLIVTAGLWRQGWLGGARRLIRVSWSSAGDWRLADGRNDDIPASLSEDSRIGGSWLWLRWHTHGGRRELRSMLLLKGDLPPVELRRLVVRLRLESVSRAGA